MSSNWCFDVTATNEKRIVSVSASLLIGQSQQSSDKELEEKGRKGSRKNGNGAREEQENGDVHDDDHDIYPSENDIVDEEGNKVDVSNDDAVKIANSIERMVDMGTEKAEYFKEASAKLKLS